MTVRGEVAAVVDARGVIEKVAIDVVMLGRRRVVLRESLLLNCEFLSTVL
jgi:hypothetical protein